MYVLGIFMDGWMMDGWMGRWAGYLSTLIAQHASLRATGACVRSVLPPHRIDEPREPYLRSAQRHGVIGTRTIVANSAHFTNMPGGERVCLQKRRAAWLVPVSQARVGTDRLKHVLVFCIIVIVFTLALVPPPACCGVATGVADGSRQQTGRQAGSKAKQIKSRQSKAEGMLGRAGCQCEASNKKHHREQREVPASQVGVTAQYECMARQRGQWGWAGGWRHETSPVRKAPANLTLVTHGMKPDRNASTTSAAHTEYKANEPYKFSWQVGFSNGILAQLSPNSAGRPGGGGGISATPMPPTGYSSARPINCLAARQQPYEPPGDQG